MLIFDQLKRSDRQLQLLSALVLLGMSILVAGLWWVQIASSKRHEANLKKQSFRSVRVPALRGKIYDRNGAVLADNRPQYNVNLYFEELVDLFSQEYSGLKKEFIAQNPKTRIAGKVRDQMILEARYRAVSNLTLQVTTALGEPQTLERRRFLNHFSTYPYVPFTILANLNPRQVSVFAERFTGIRGLEMETQATRFYPHGTAAAHLLGYARMTREPVEDEDISFNFKYYFPYPIGIRGLESTFEPVLRGKAGVQSTLVNVIGYRQRDEILSQTEPGANVQLTIDLAIQTAAEKALATSMANLRGAVVVMDTRNGDVLAMASAPTFDPNAFPNGISSEDYARLNDEKNSHMFNRATYGAYPPGSIFKIVTALAGMESGVLNPTDTFFVPPDPARPGKGAFFLGRRKIEDTAPTGNYDFERAFKLSSNTYFIHYGLVAGMQRMLMTGNKFYFGQKTGVLPREEVAGFFPSYDEVKGRWSDGNLANVSMGQEITVTPIQAAVMTSAIANGGKIFWPRLIKQVQTAAGEPINDVFPATGGLRADLHLNSRFLDFIHRGMAADVADSDGTGRECYISGFPVGGKTGTAEIKHGRTLVDKVTWFASFGPMDNPRYAVVVMVQSGASGGRTCAPIARKVYEAIIKQEAGAVKTPVLATLN